MEVFIALRVRSVLLCLRISRRYHSAFIYDSHLARRYDKSDSDMKLTDFDTVIPLVIFCPKLLL